MPRLQSSDLCRVFATLDQDDNGRLSIDELNWLLKRLGVPMNPDELEDVVGSKELDLQEFISFYESKLLRDDDNGDDGDNGDDDERDLVEAFKVFDLNDDGFISSGELKSVLISLGLFDESSGDCTRMIGNFDLNLDGQIDFEEFKNMMMLMRVRV